MQHTHESLWEISCTRGTKLHWWKWVNLNIGCLFFGSDPVYKQFTQEGECIYQMQTRSWSDFGKLHAVPFLWQIRPYRAKSGCTLGTIYKTDIIPQNRCYDGRIKPFKSSINDIKIGVIMDFHSNAFTKYIIIMLTKFSKPAVTLENNY